MLDATGEPTRAREWSDRLAPGARRLAAVFTVWSYGLLVPFGLAGFALLCFLWRGDPERRARRLQHVTVNAYRFMHHWLRWVRITDFDHRRPVPGVPDGPCVVIANHPTLMDITSVSALLGRGFTIVKPQMFHRPLLHPLLVGAGHMVGPSADVLSIGAVVEEAVGHLRRGSTLIVFPEGTRSRGGQLLPFGRTPFEIACRAGVPLVSLGIRCDPVYLSKEVPVYRPPHPTAKLRLELLAVDDPATAGGDSRELLRRIENRYQVWWSGAAHESAEAEARRAHEDQAPRAPSVSPPQGTATHPWTPRNSPSKTG